MLNYFKLEQTKNKKDLNGYKAKLYSRFYITPKINYDSKIVWNIFSWMKYDFYINKWIYHIVKENERLDIISFKYYNTIKYWWIIALFNSDTSLDPYKLETPGMKLRIPDREEIINFMDRFSQQQDKIYDPEERIVY